MFRVFVSILKKEWTITRRYPMNFISSLITIYIIFLLIFIGYRSVGMGNPGYTRNLESIIVGFFLWTFALAAYSRLSWGIMSESSTGTFEQLYMSPIGFKMIAIFIVISDFLISFLLEIPVVIFMMLVTGRWLHIDLVTLIILFIPTIGAVYGIGFATGGIALVYKRIQSFFQILQFLMVLFVMIPVNRYPAAKVLPLTLGNHLIKLNMTQGVPFYKLPLQDLAFLYINFLFYFLLGLIIFSKFEFQARRKGILGHY